MDGKAEIERKACEIQLDKLGLNPFISSPEFTDVMFSFHILYVLYQASIHNLSKLGCSSKQKDKRKLEAMSKPSSKSDEISRPNLHKQNYFKVKPCM